MFKNLKYILFVILLLSLVGCSIKTPEISGIVLDEEAGQPVEGAWIHATLEIETKTIQGNVANVLSVDPPHTRTGRDGRFMIPSRKFKKPLPPVGFGTEVKSFGVSATTIDDKSGGFYLKDYERKKKIEVTIYVKPWEKGLKDEGEYFSYIQSLYRYCLSGRFGVEVPPVEGGCDPWELDFAIRKHERYLERFKIIIEERGYSSAIDQLAFLYEKKGDYEKTIEILNKSISMMEKKGLLKFEIWQRNKKGIEWKINQLQEKLEGVKK